MDQNVHKNGDRSLRTPKAVSKGNTFSKCTRTNPGRERLLKCRTNLRSSLDSPLSTLKRLTPISQIAGRAARMKRELVSETDSVCYSFRLPPIKFKTGCTFLPIRLAAVGSFRLHKDKMRTIADARILLFRLGGFSRQLDCQKHPCLNTSGKHL